MENCWRRNEGIDSRRHRQRGIAVFADGYYEARNDPDITPPVPPAEQRH